MFFSRLMLRMQCLSVITINRSTVVNTVHIAGGTSPLQWPALGWPDGEINFNDSIV